MANNNIFNFPSILDGCKILRRSSNNTYTVESPDGTKFYEVGNSNPGLKFYVDQDVSIMFGKSNPPKAVIIAPRQGLRHVPSIIELCIITYDDGTNERILIHNSKLNGIKCLNSAPSGTVSQDIAAIASPVSFFGYPAHELATIDYEDIGISVSSEAEGFDGANVLNFTDGSYWRTLEKIENSHHIIFDFSNYYEKYSDPPTTTSLKIFVAISPSGQADGAASITINDPTLLDITEPRFSNNYETFFYGPFLITETEQSIRIDIPNSLDGSNIASLGKIHFYEASHDEIEGVTSSTTINVQSDDGGIIDTFRREYGSGYYGEGEY